MDTINANMLTILTFLPLVGALFMLFIPGDTEMRAQNAKKLALLFSSVTFILSLSMLSSFDPLNASMQFETKNSWISALNANYHMGVDGISVLFVVLTSLLTPICILVSWKSISDRVPLYMAAFLALEAFVIGVFCALDMLLFYVFWEAMLIPMFLIIGVWGGENRVYAALKFFLYTFLGSVLMLVALIYLYLQNGSSFDILSMQNIYLDTHIQMWLFVAFFAAFAVKVPMWPFHTWLPDAHVQAPTAGSVILAGILLKMGAYGFLRFSIPILPDATYIFAPYIYALSTIAIIYTALVAFAQTDVKKMIAYSSVSHMGFVTLGIFAATVESVQGAVMQMVNHGIVAAALFMLIGIIYDRMHTREISRFGGIVNRMPFYATLFMLFTMAAIGLPGTNSFVGEFLILTGSYGAQNAQIYVVLACLGIVLGAVYMLSLYKRMILGEPKTQEIMRLQHMDKREKAMFIPLVVLVLYLGFAPNKMLNITEASVRKLVEDYEVKVVEYKNSNVKIVYAGDK
jgi:NADH-quinone oxidoreductase subunit M